VGLQIVSTLAITRKPKNKKKILPKITITANKRIRGKVVK
jgi:hypothetical protein